jgi:predicted GIY-YIG superfamily endonuclease
MKKYTFEQLKIEASKYKTPNEFRKNSPLMCNASHKRKIYQDISKHFIKRKTKPTNFYTKEVIRNEALKYINSKDWANNSNGSYQAALRLKLLKDKTITGHFIPLSKSHKKYSDEDIKVEALKYKTKKDWIQNSNWSYQAALYRKIVGEVSKHMVATGNRYKRCLYSISIPEYNIVYIGLTLNFNQRIKQHLSSKRFKNLINKYGRYSLTIKQETDYTDVQTAINLERAIIKEFTRQGKVLLNETSGGEAGSGALKKWNKEKIYETTKKYIHYKDWYTNERNAYRAAFSLGIIKEVSKYLKRPIYKPKVLNLNKKIFKKWNIYLIKEEALKYKTKEEWRIKSNYSPISININLPMIIY